MTTRLLQKLKELTSDINGHTINEDIAVNLEIHKSFKPFLKKSLELCPIEKGPYAHIYKEREKLGKFEGRKVLKLNGNGDDIVTEDGEGYITQKHRIVGDNPEADKLKETISIQGFKLTLLPPVFAIMPDGNCHIGTGNGRIYAVSENDVKDIICDVYDFSEMKEVDAQESFLLLGQITNRSVDVNSPFTAEDLANTLYNLYQLGKIDGDLNKSYDTLQENIKKRLDFIIGDSYFKPSEYQKSTNIFLDRLNSKNGSNKTIIPRNWSKEGNRERWLKAQGYKNTKFVKYVTVSASIVTKAQSDIGEKYKNYAKKLTKKDRHKLQLRVIINCGLLENDTIEKQVLKRNQDYYKFYKKWYESIENNLYYYKSMNNNSGIETTEEKIKFIGGMPYFRHNNEGNKLITVEQIKKLNRKNVKKKKNI